MSRIQFHPLSNLFPTMSSGEYADLVEDIKKNGLREPIWIYEEQILDGRNRYCACEDAGIEPETRLYEGDDPVSFVLSQNLHRRHLTESQRAMVGANLANLPSHRPKKSANLQTSASEVAAQLNVSVRSIQSAKVVTRRGSPELQDAVRAGEISVSAGAEIAKLPPEHQLQFKDRRSQKRRRKLPKRLDQESENTDKRPAHDNDARSPEAKGSAPVAVDETCIRSDVPGAESVSPSEKVQSLIRNLLEPPTLASVVAANTPEEVRGDFLRRVEIAVKWLIELKYQLQGTPLFEREAGIEQHGGRNG